MGAARANTVTTYGKSFGACCFGRLPEARHAGRSTNSPIKSMYRAARSTRYWPATNFKVGVGLLVVRGDDYAPAVPDAEIYIWKTGRTTISCGLGEWQSA